MAVYAQLMAMAAAALRARNEPSVTVSVSRACCIADGTLGPLRDIYALCMCNCNLCGAGAAAVSFRLLPCAGALRLFGL